MWQALPWGHISGSWSAASPSSPPGSLTRLSPSTLQCGRVLVLGVKGCGFQAGVCVCVCVFSHVCRESDLSTSREEQGLLCPSWLALTQEGVWVSLLPAPCPATGTHSWASVPQERPAVWRGQLYLGGDWAGVGGP